MNSLTMDDYRAAMKDGHLAVTVCGACEHQQAIPADTCFSCGSGDLHLKSHSGIGRVHSWVVANYAFAPELESEVPYTVVLVDLDGGGRAYGRLEGADGKQSRVEGNMTIVLDVEATKKRGYPVYRPGPHNI